MKKIALCSILACFSCFLSGQSVGVDSTFGEDGVVVSGLYGIGGNPYGIDFVGLPDGKIIIGGSNADYVGLEKYDNAGALDANFSTSFVESDGFETGVSLQKDGKVLLIGENTTDLTTFAIRMDTSGNLDQTFGNGGIAQTFVSHFFAHNIFEQSDGRVVVFGDEWTNFSSFSAVRFLPNGILDNTFATNGKLTIDLPEYAHEVPISGVEQPDHKLLFAGSIGYPIWNILMVRINPDGTRDSTFGEDGIVIDSINGNSNAYGLVLQPDGKILLSGDTYPNYQAIVSRYNYDGTRDTNFGEQGVQYLPQVNEGIGIALRPDGKILTANWDWDTFPKYPVLAQLLPNGQRDVSFGNNGIFRIIDPGMRPRALSLIGNKATLSGRKHTGTTLKRLFRFLLDLNVGTVNPNNQPDNTLWLYPNPIASQFTFEFGLSQKEHVNIRLYDMQGKLIQSFAQDQAFEQGEHKLSLSCADYLAAGNYVLTLEVAGKKMSSVQVTKQ